MTTFTSIYCKNCIDPTALERSQARGVLPRGLWEDEYNGTCTCTNCGFARPYHKRSRKPRIKMTKSQTQALARIRKYFDGSRFSDNGKPTKDLYELEVTPSDYDDSWWVSVNTTDNVFTNEGGQFHIGSRGAITIYMVYNLTDDKEFYQRHYAKMLGGKVSK